MKNKKSNKKSTTKSSKSKKEPETHVWLFENIAEASKNARKIYLLYVGFLIYCILSVISTTDKQIILNDKVSLPILNIDVPLNGFFLLAPVIAIFVFIYFQFYLIIRKDLICIFEKNYPQIGKECLYPWMFIILDYTKKGVIGRLQSAVVKFSVWCLVPFFLMIISTWFVKKHDPDFTYFFGMIPFFGTVIVLWFWCRYEDVFKIRQIPILILNNLGKIFLIFIVIFYVVFFRFFIIPGAFDGFGIKKGEGTVLNGKFNVKKKILYRYRSFFCVDLSYQKLITEPITDYKEIYWLDLRKAHLEGANLDSTIMKRVDLRNAILKKATMVNSVLQEANLEGACLRDAFLWKTNLQDANLLFSDLQGAFLADTNLQKANLQGANLQSAILSDANLQGANFRECDLRGARYLYVEQLSKVKTLYDAKLDSEIREEIKKKYPHLLEEPRPEVGEENE